MTSITISVLPRGPDTFGITQQGFSLTIPNNYTVARLKEDIQDTQSISRTKQLLWFGSTKLADDTVQVRIAGIQDGSTLYLRERILLSPPTAFSFIDDTLPNFYSGTVTENIDYYRIYYYRPSSSTREDLYVKGTDVLSTVMASLNMPNNQYSVTLSGNLLVGAQNYSRTLNSLGINEDSVVRFSM